MRSTRLEVNLNSLKSNLNMVKQIAKGREIIAVIKADAYGLGSIAVAKAIVEEGVSFFLVALLEEAQLLRDHHIQKKILLTSPFTEKEIPDLLKFSIIPTLSDYLRAKALNNFGYNINQVIPVHIKVDTGMGRLGVKVNEAFDFIRKLTDLGNLRIEGIYSHFPSADIPDIEFTEHQIVIFSKLVSQSKCFLQFQSHLANSSGIINFPNAHFDVVRPGIMLYGCYPSPYTRAQINLSKVITLKTEVICLKKIDPGESVSYGRTFIAKDERKVAVLPIGYADGYSTLLSNIGEVVIQNKKVPVIGRVSMDYTMVDVTSLNDIQIGEEVVLIGDGITEEEIALKTGLIPYEILTSISKRVPRIYVS